MVADPKIANVQAIQSNRLYVVGSSIGDTNLIALDELGNVIKKMNIHVWVDTDSIEAMVSELFPQEKNVQVHMIGSHLALSGSVSTPSAAQKIVRLVAARMGEVQKKDAKDGDSIIEKFVGSSLANNKLCSACVFWKYPARFLKNWGLRPVPTRQAQLVRHCLAVQLQAS